MPVPKFHEIFPNVLSELSRHHEITATDLTSFVVESLGLTTSELAEEIRGGGNRVRSRVHWAIAYLVQAGAIERPARGIIRLTGFGQELLNGPPEGLSKAALDQSPGIKAWAKRSQEKAKNKKRKDKDTTSAVDGDLDEPDFDDQNLNERDAPGEAQEEATEDEPPRGARPEITDIYSVAPHSVETILAWVSSGDIAIPEIQRPFVWQRTDVRDLLDSLYSGFPVGYLITWRNPTVRLKTGGLSSGKRILIDGQQRVTALMTALLGIRVLNTDYNEVRMTLSFHPLRQEFQVANAATRNDPSWIYDIADLFTSGASTYRAVTSYCERNTCTDDEREQVAKSLERLAGIKTNQIGIIELSSELDVEWVQEIFKRVNSQGKKLSQADFAMSKIAVNEHLGGGLLRKAIDYFCHLSRAPEKLDQIFDRDVEFSQSPFAGAMRWLKDFNSDIYDPTYPDMLRVAAMTELGRGHLADVVALLSGRNFETREYEESIEEESFAKLSEGIMKFINKTNFTNFVMILRSAGFVSSEMITSQSAVSSAYALYLRCRNEKIEPSTTERIVRQWFVMSILTNRYSGSFESRLDQDLRLMRDNGIEQTLKTVLESSMTDGFWDALLPQQMETSYARSTYWNVFRASQVYGKIKGFLSTEILTQDLIAIKGDVHHVFPRAYLKSRGFSAARYNQIANFVQMQSEINIRIGARSPAQYFTTLSQQTSGGAAEIGGITDREMLLDNLRDHALPIELLDSEIPYEEFLILRRRLMAAKIRDYFRSL